MGNHLVELQIDSYNLGVQRTRPYFITQKVKAIAGNKTEQMYMDMCRYSGFVDARKHYSWTRSETCEGQSFSLPKTPAGHVPMGETQSITR
jgi:hypothetical protein